MNLVNIRKIKLFLRDYWSTLATLVSLVVLIVLISVTYANYKESQNQLDVLTEEVKLLKNRNDTLNYNKSLSANDIEVYNKILSTLIPESEDYFSIIYALETISQKTGFRIIGYQVNLSKTSPEKLAISVEGKGSSGDFLKFLNNYEFAGGRLVTSEKIEFSGGGSSNTKVALNFYNKQYAFGQTVVPQLTQKDIDQLNAIKQKVQVTLTDTAETTDAEYETTTNPF